MQHRFLAPLIVPWRFMRHSAHLLWAMQTRERLRLWREMHEVRGLLPLLMKQRNGYRWTELDRRRIRVHVRKLVELSPYMVLFVAPGGFFMLPLLVWWLDRRHPAHLQVLAAPAVTLATAGEDAPAQTVEAVVVIMPATQAEKS
ncbi:MAG: hypothetical protein REI95_03690 [Oxalicibacterium faecigallinarum]|nr:hypothetical protein [Oxalicibacterium faecigallinarum]